MIRRSLVLVLALGLLGSAGCSDDEPEVRSGPSTTAAGPGGDVGGTDLDGRTFVSTSVTGHELVAGSTVRLSFEAGRLSASAGCNSMNGPYELDGGTLTVTDMASTMMGCEPALMDQDQWLSSFLTSGPTLELADDTMTLGSDAVTIALVDQSVAEPARPLVGTTWNLETIIEDETSSSVPAGVETPTFQIGEDGFAAVFTGCNRGSTAVGLNGATMSFGPLRLTKMACPGDAQAVESAVVAVLADEATFAIDGDRLTLTKGDQGLVYRAG